MDGDSDAAGLHGHVSSTDHVHHPAHHLHHHHHHHHQNVQYHQQLDRFDQNHDSLSHNYIATHHNSRSPLALDEHEIVTDNHNHHAFTPVNPDDFYKSYRVPHHDTNISPESLPMASASIHSPPVRSNGDDGTASHNSSTVSSPKLNIPRPTNLRSASNPLDNKPVTSRPQMPSGKPSVKDLTKRFDQQNGSAGSSIPRAPVRPSRVARQAKRDGATNPPTSYSAVRTGTAFDSPGSIRSSSASPQTQRAKFVAEDHVSNNSQSFASRLGKPRSQASGNPKSTPSVTHPSGNSTALPQPPLPSSNTASPSTLSSQGLLFGEILPEQYDTTALGFGIESLREPPHQPGSNINGQWAHQRSLSDPDADLPLPGSWSKNPANDETGSRPNPSATTTKTRTARSLSDATSQKPTTQRIVRRPAARKALSPEPKTGSSASSKLPRSVRKLNGTDDSTSPSSTRSSSPISRKRPGEGRTSRATTPTYRAKTPVQSGMRQNSTGLPTPNSNTRLQAYIAAPPPKLSPPLRSSRPRQPVSMATTASSRMKSVDKPRSVSASVASMHSRPQENSSRRRKISVGPIDFEQRREHIRLAYSKSLRETQALEARQRAAENRRKEMEAAAKAKAAAEAAAIATQVTEDGPDEKITEVTETIEHRDVIRDVIDTITEEPNIMEEITTPVTPVDTNAPDALDATPVPALQKNTSPESKDPQPVTVAKHPDSPTLGVPGSFPALSPPMLSPPRTREDPHASIVSPVSDTTEFDTEPQVTSQVAPVTPPRAPITVVKSPSPQALVSRTRAEYQYPFEDEPDSPERKLPNRSAQPAILPRTRHIQPVEPVVRQSIPGAFEDEEEFSPADSLPAPPVMVQESEKVLVLPSDHSAELVEAEQRLNVPFPRLEMQDESDCQSEFDDDYQEPDASTHHDQDDGATDACTECTEDMARTEDCQSESRFGASSCASSDAGGDEDLDYLTYDQQSPDIQANSLLVPPMKNKRNSHHSAWTDLTVETSGHSDVGKSPDLLQDDDDEEPPAGYGHVTIFGSRVISRETESQSKEASDDHASGRPSCSSSRGSSAYLDYQSPEIEGGDGFAIPFLTPDLAAGSSYIPALPDHDPPPVPPSASGSAMDSRRASSVFYDQSQRGSMMYSERGSGDFTSQLETPQTADTNSIATSENYFSRPPQMDGEAKESEEDLTEKDRRRLMQRRNVIKELVDTEAVFVRDMNIVEEIYKGTAEACPRLDDKTVKQIFRNSDEIIEFHTIFLAQIKEAATSVYVPKTGRRAAKEDRSAENASRVVSDVKDREVTLGPVFHENLERMKTVHESFLRSSDQAAKRLIHIQQDPTVQVWLNECNEVAKDLTAAWDLDSLLIKPMQRITKYPNLIITLLQHTPEDHPDRETLVSAKDTLEAAIIDINKTKKNFELVGQIVGRKRKESDVKLGIARAFGKRVDKLQPGGTRIPEDPDYSKMSEKFGDDFLRLQVVLRDVEFYTRQVSTYVREFLNYLSSVELVMRLQPGSYPEIESKWVQFNISIRDIEKVALEDHLAQVRKHVVEPFEHVIKAYGNPSLAMKKRQKRRLDYERLEQLKRGGKTGDSKLQELVEQYEALNDTLKKELPKLSALTEQVGNICLGNFVRIQTKWYGIWKDKMKKVLVDCPDKPDLAEVVASFQRDFPYVQEQLGSIGILQPTPRGRPSQSTAASGDEPTALTKVRSPRPSDVDTTRARQASFNGEAVPPLPTPEFVKRDSAASSSMSPTHSKPLPTSPHQYYYRDFYAGNPGQSSSSTSAMTTDMTGSSRSVTGTTAPTSTRPSTGRSYDSMPMPRRSMESASLHRQDSSATYASAQPQDRSRFSGLFHSALPLPDTSDDRGPSSRASSRERAPSHDRYNVLWLAASLFEFNIATTKHEAGYPYLVYQAGEIFDVIAEKGELWLAKNQDDPNEQVGWIWSKHFAKLADS